MMYRDTKDRDDLITTHLNLKLSQSQIVSIRTKKKSKFSLIMVSH